MERKTSFNNKKLFKTPDNYFESFEGRLMQNIEQKNNSVSKPQKRIKRYYYSSIAATIALVIGLTFFYTSEKQETLKDEAISNYIEYNTTLTLSSDFINSFDEQDIQELEQSIELNQKEINDYVLTNIDIEYYLND
ncbi:MULTISPECIES: hypothetical protein [Myroides]|uniref:Uncharacterized protein n=1 Tax=Myroides albus TaxID=2562892 RepID=A0A6I3LG23_9FLAO|nr:MULTISPECIES: hypothetical protein [Myroides]MTG97123.1 hypothetical protein [Myroides albus]MVX35144.1 hypothetical protein [Myroides sp. LoEW2-1]UVD78865.1 hypothetical protein NWE55_12145 [Myroides albus]